MSSDSSDTTPKVVIVTGASRRIGAAIASAAHSQGYRVLVHYRSSEKEARILTEKFNKHRSDSAVSVHADFADSNSCEQLVSACISHWGRLDLLVNNASEFYPTPVGSISKADLQKLYAANVFAPLLLSQAAQPHLKIQQGSIVNIVDIYASVVRADYSVYSSCKAALQMLTKSLAVELAPQVRVNGIAPGAILWPDGGEALSKIEKQTLLQKVPMQKKGNAEQIAAAVLFLASEDAGFTTGQILSVDGGRSLYS